MAATDDIRAGASEAFKELRGVFFPGVDAALLKVSEDTNDFQTVLILDNWFFDKETRLLQISENSLELKTAIKNSTHLRIGDDVFIREGEAIEPQGTLVFWKIGHEGGLKKNQFGSYY
jgi:hypothetical protein